MYISNKYIHNNFDHNIRRHAHTNDAKTFLRKNCQWNNITFSHICWPPHSSSLNNMLETRKWHAIRFINHRLPIGKMQFGLNKSCLHRNILLDHVSGHDHFLTCLKAEDNKFKRIKNIELAMLQLHTHTQSKTTNTPSNITYYQSIQKCKQQNIYPPSEDNKIT